MACCLVATPFFSIFSLTSPLSANLRRMLKIAKDIPIQKMRLAEDVANTILFLASDESNYVTGIELTVDGGILAGASATPKKQD